jgi:transposase-like protein
MDQQDRQDGQERNGSLGSPEVPEKASRRRFDAGYKLRILAEAERCQASGQLGELLRREGLYSSHLMTWRKQRDAGALDALTPKQRGRKALPNAAERKELERLRRENARLTHRLKQAETIIEVQKKVAEMLGNPIDPPEEGRSA